MFCLHDVVEDIAPRDPHCERAVVVTVDGTFLWIEHANGQRWRVCASEWRRREGYNSYEAAKEAVLAHDAVVRLHAR